MSENSMSLHERMMQARQAQQDHAQKHDVQLELLPFTTAEIGNWTVCWATENEYREHWHQVIDDEWHDYILEYYGDEK